MVDEGHQLRRRGNVVDVVQDGEARRLVVVGEAIELIDGLLDLSSRETGAFLTNPFGHFDLLRARQRRKSAGGTRQTVGREDARQQTGEAEPELARRQHDANSVKS